MTKVSDKIQKRKRRALDVAYRVTPVDAESGRITLTFTTDRGAIYSFALDASQAGFLGHELASCATDAQLAKMSELHPEGSPLNFAAIHLALTVQELTKDFNRRLESITAEITEKAGGDRELAELIASSASWSKQDRERAVTSAKMIFKGYQPEAKK